MGNCTVVVHSPIDSTAKEKIRIQDLATDNGNEYSSNTLTVTTMNNDVKMKSSHDENKICQQCLNHLFKPRNSVVSDETTLMRGFSEYLCAHSSTERIRMMCVQSMRPMLCFEFRELADLITIRRAFSHPLLVEAAESLFLVVLKFVKEQEVVKEGLQLDLIIRILDSKGNDIVDPLRSGDVNISCILGLMTRGLHAAGIKIPMYLLLLKYEQEGKKCLFPDGSLKRIDRQAVFGTSSPQECEVFFGEFDGVFSTSLGLIDRCHVIEIGYNSTLICYCKLIRYALQERIIDLIYHKTNDEKIAALIEIKNIDSAVKLAPFPGIIKPSIETKYALRQTMLRYVPLTDLQATKANRLIALGVFNEATHLLSPKQGSILMRCINNKSKEALKEVINLPINEAWREISKCDESMF
jgi:hypothetical protein